MYQVLGIVKSRAVNWLLWPVPYSPPGLVRGPHGSAVGRQNKIRHLASSSFKMWKTVEDVIPHVEEQEVFDEQSNPVQCGE